MNPSELSMIRWRKSSRSTHTGGECVEVGSIPPSLTWHKSSHSSGQGQCVEVADLAPVAAGWRKSSHSDTITANCVEVAALVPAVAVRDSKSPEGPALVFTADDWAAFTGRIKSGELDAG